MVIDMNESKLETIEQIREFLAGISEVAFSIPADESKRRVALWSDSNSAIA